MSIARHLLYVIPTLVGLWLFDNAISEDRTVGWERNSVRNSQTRWERRPRAKVAIFGSSTSKDWLPVTLAAKVTGTRAGDVLDAHINGCHQDCTWASVRSMVREERRFEVAFFGTNLFQLCEHDHSKRVLQQVMQVPSPDIPALFGHYLDAEKPLRPMARFIGMQFSGAYGDTKAPQRYLNEDLFGKPKRGRTHRWYTARRPGGGPPPTCSYDDDAIAYKVGLSAALLDDLGEIADHVFLMMLPDRTTRSEAPEMRERWARHMAVHRRLADERDHVTLVDLVADGVTDPKLFRDGFHLNKRGIPQQQALFQRRMAELGWPRPKAPPETGKPGR